MKNVLLADVRYYLLRCVSKPFFTVTQCCCPRGKSLSLSLSSRTNLQVLVLEPEVLVVAARRHIGLLNHNKCVFSARRNRANYRKRANGMSSLSSECTGRQQTLCKVDGVIGDCTFNQPIIIDELVESRVIPYYPASQRG